MNQHLTLFEIQSTITSKGQITIPASIRKRLGLKKKDKVAFVIQKEGEILLKVPQYPSMTSLKGAAGKLSKPLSSKEMKRIAYEDRLG